MVSPKKKFFFFDFYSNTDRQVLPAVLEAKNPMHAQRFGNLVSEKASYGGSTNSKACEEAKVRAGGSRLGSKKTRGVPEGEKELLILGPNGEFD